MSGFKYRTVLEIFTSSFNIVNPSFFVQHEWPQGYQLATSMNFKFPQFSRTPLSTIVPSASEDGILLLEHLLLWQPGKRPTAQQALRFLSEIVVCCLELFIS